MDQKQTKAANTVRMYNQSIQNYLVIWVDAHIDPMNKDFKTSLLKLHDVVNDIKLCTTSKQCLDYLHDLDDRKAFIISSGSLGQHLVADIHNLTKVNKIYIFCVNKARYEQLTKKWPKIEGIYTSIEPICESLKKAIHEGNYNDMPISFISKKSIAAVSGSDKENLNQLPLTYMYSTIFKDIILEIKDDHEKQMEDFINYCRKREVLESQVIDFQKWYHQKSPAWWYTCEIFLYGMLNKSLRTLDMEGMMKIGFFIRHLHRRLEELHKEQSANFTEEFIVYRGQGLSSEDFRDLSNSKDGLLSFNNFLSTNKQKKISMGFVQNVMHKSKDYVAVLFIMTIDPKKISANETPFAWVDNESAADPKEDEILFTMHTVFLVMDIKQSSENAHLHEVQLFMTGNNDPQLALLNNYIKKSIRESTEWHGMAKFMLKMGHFNQAEELYNRLLQDAENDEDRAFIYHQLGLSKDSQGEYPEAGNFYEKSLKVVLKTVSENDISLAPTYRNMGLVYKNMGEYSKALQFYEKSHQIYEKTLSPNHPDLATSYSCTGRIYSSMGKYSKALDFYEKSHQIYEKILPPSHLSLTTSFNNIGGVYEDLGDYAKAVQFYEKSYKIKEKALPLNHPSFATSYDNIGLAYYGKGNYLKALQYLEQGLAIRRKTLPSAHPLIQQSINNIASVKKKM